MEYKEPNKAIVRHIDEDDRMKRPITDELGRKQGTDFVAIAQKKVTAQGNQSEFICDVTHENSYAQ